MSNSEYQIAKGLQTGDNINQALAELTVAKSASMLKNALKSDFNTVLEARLTEAVSAVLVEHAETSQQFAQHFLMQTKTKLAGHLVDSQHHHPIVSIPESMSLSQLESFDVDLDAEVARIADEAGTLTIDVNPDSFIGF
ncbi:hypothetical protein [Gloeothece verrucosa]|uniref:Uncharacterized protein n=1 Tax=Gloeothece verrucosa (strain PCC 7822) TaxID=497965 RepID=E0UMG1_GLOV7|nr:hypothetical protein [Gloeothece verrucosa]ADN18141.1 hypothetical protein Cyan7822_6351 [Gloeothece verrucosa PCC 7822]